MEKLDIPQGTLDLMILTLLAREAMHGYGISQRLAMLSHDQFHVNPGSLFPSLYRLEQDGKQREYGRPLPPATTSDDQLHRSLPDRAVHARSTDGTRAAPLS